MEEGPGDARPLQGVIPRERRTGSPRALSPSEGMKGPMPVPVPTGACPSRGVAVPSAVSQSCGAMCSRLPPYSDPFPARHSPPPPRYHPGVPGRAGNPGRGGATEPPAALRGRQPFSSAGGGGEEGPPAGCGLGGGSGSGRPWAPPAPGWARTGKVRVGGERSRGWSGDTPPCHASVGLRNA